jgi:hypothetical protein
MPHAAQLPASFLAGVTHRSHEVRNTVARLLRIRGALDVETAEKLLTDNDLSVRYEALMALERAGRKHTAEETRKILVTITQSALSGLFGRPDPKSEAVWNEFKFNQLLDMDEKSLRENLATSTVFDQEYFFALAVKQFRSLGNELREVVGDQFQRHFDEAMETMERVPGSGAMIKRVRDVKDFARAKLTRQGLDLICSKLEPVDLSLVRRMLKTEFVECSDSIIKYVCSYGEWNDIPLLLTTYNRKKASRNLLFMGDDEEEEKLAGAIYNIGRKRLDDLLVLSMPRSILGSVVATISDQKFRRLMRDTLRALLFSEDESVRRVTALKIVATAGKLVLKKLLDDYMSDEGRRFYNVVHWLDFGISMSRSRVIEASSRALNGTWKNRAA